MANDPHIATTSDDEQFGCFVAVVAALTALGFHQMQWSWALGAVAGIFAAIILVYLPLLLIRQRKPDTQQLVARVKELEDTIRQLRNEKPQTP